jgi:lipid II isoglutaminyl synthase (glutamine-hydrolysing)
LLALKLIIKRVKMLSDENIVSSFNNLGKDINLRRTLAIITGKSVLNVLKRAGRGGTALPGLLAHSLDPHILNNLTARLPSGSLVVTGTNGKTTTTRLISTILDQAGLKVVNNRSGSNLIRGLISTLLTESNIQGKIGADIGLFEVDEAAFPLAVGEIAPKTILINNLFRDQLDRYGELDTIRKKWISAIEKLPPNTTLVLNADDPSLAYVSRFAPQGVKVVFYGLDDPHQQLAALPHAVDSARCVVCQAPLIYSAVYISHMGHYRCSQCDFSRPKLDYTARNVTLNGTQGSGFSLENSESLDLNLGIPGLYNVYNAAGAATLALTLGLAPVNIQNGLENFKAAFGRIERVNLPEAKQLLLVLVKNPVGFNEVLRMLTQSQDQKLKLLILLNDLTADGRDISWLWDVDFEILADRVAWGFTGGLRAPDMALRLKYAGVPADLLSAHEDIAEVLDKAIVRLESGETLYVLPTYTAMLKLREVLTKKGLVLPFWEE